MTVTVVMGSYRRLPEPPTFVSRAAKAAKTLTLRTPAKLYIYETLLEGLAQYLQHVTAELGQFIQKEHAVVGQRHLARHRHLSPADQAHIGDGVKGSANRRVVTKAMRPPVRPGTQWTLAASMASAKLISGKIVVRQQARMDWPAQGP